MAAASCSRLRIADALMASIAEPALMPARSAGDSGTTRAIRCLPSGDGSGGDHRAPVRALRETAAPRDRATGTMKNAAM
jgi:hypothetical protein